MNVFLNNLVALNKIILENAQQQFISSPSATGRALESGAAALPDDLTAAVNTEIVSGETRYQIITESDGTSWSLRVNFSLNQSVPVIPYVVLSFSQFGQFSEMVFDAVSQLPDRRYTARLKLTRLEQRDALLRALSNYDAKTTLVVLIRTDDDMLNTITDPKIFYFAENYYPYIYQGIAPPPARLELILKPLDYNNVWYNYYQDNRSRDYFYYLPDKFMLATDSANNNKPMLSISFSVPEGATEPDQVNVTFEYFLLPKVNQQRIRLAATAFSAAQPNSTLIPFASASQLELQLWLPAGKTPQPNALINLQSGIADGFTVPSAQFGKIWDAFFATAAQHMLLKGELSVKQEGFPADTLAVQLTLDAQYKNQPALFIDQSAPVDITRTLTFVSRKGSFDPNGPKPIERILISAGNKTRVLSAEVLQQSVQVKVSALQVILNPAATITYRYSLQIHYADGSTKNINDQSSIYETIYVP
ncbi:MULTISPECIES: hypothetical protein [Dickeya]|uniref:Uncharacterized protein n=1 Tax=Dickeya aquatica TaxID=1401087 RepID=A0A375A969_9GAMM|nr:MULTISPECIES: hypothetical protein [Dickeya]SLM62583.1 FIG01222964: hypothetical protein [Dickeya aquatica]